MSPTPRRSSGKARVRGGRGSDRGGSKLNVMTRKNERGNTCNKRSGGRTTTSTSSSMRPTRAVTTVLKKLVVRNIPSTASEQQTRELLWSHGVKDEFIWRFVPGRKRSNNRTPIPGRVYLDMKKEPEKARKLISALNGQMFDKETQENVDATPLVVEFAPFQKIAREKQRKDAKVGTLDRDPDYLSFLEELSKPKDKLPSAEALVDMAEGQTIEKPVAALIKYLNERKSHSRDKSKGKSLDKSGRRQKGKKEKSTKDKSKTSKDRRKSSNGDAVVSEGRKQRGKPASKMELDSSKTVHSQPGMLRIMTPNSANNESTVVIKANEFAQSLETQSQHGADNRGKGGKKTSGRSNTKRNGVGDGEDEDGTKSHPRRKFGTGRKESLNKAERKKKVFAPKDAVGQGTPTKIR